MPRRSAAPRVQVAAGFTLVELLVAITLLGLLSLALVGGLRFGARAWERVETGGRDLQDLQIARDFLNDRLERSVIPIPPDDEEEDPSPFLGTPQTLGFITGMPGRLGLQGLHRVSIEALRQGEAADLLLSWSPLAVTGQTSEAGGRRVLLLAISSLRLAYYRRGEDGAPGRWLEGWAETDALPDLVRISVGFAEGDTRAWPPLVIAPRIAVLE